MVIFHSFLYVYQRVTIGYNPNMIGDGDREIEILNMSTFLSNYNEHIVVLWCVCCHWLMCFMFVSWLHFWEENGDTSHITWNSPKVPNHWGKNRQICKFWWFIAQLMGCSRHYMEIAFALLPRPKVGLLKLDCRNPGSGKWWKMCESNHPWAGG